MPMISLPQHVQQLPADRCTDTRPQGFRRQRRLMGMTHRGQSGARCAAGRWPHRSLWPAALVIVSLGVFAIGQLAATRPPSPGALVHFPAMTAAISAAAYAWIRFRTEASGWWLTVGASFALFLVLTSEQMALEALGASSFVDGRRVPWQPWNAARLVLGLGVLSAYSAPRGLLPQAGNALRLAVRTVTCLAILACPVWAALLPWAIYEPGPNGLTTIDCVLLTAGGLVTLLAFARARGEVIGGSGDPFSRLLYTWLLALGWSAACRAFPFGSPATAAWVEMLVVGLASFVLSAQLVCVLAGPRARLEMELAGLRASSQVLANIATADRDAIAASFTEGCAISAGAQRTMLIAVSGASARVFAVYPPGSAAAIPGDALSLKPNRKAGFANGPTARAIAEGKIVVAEDVAADAEFICWRDLEEEPGIQVTIPILADGRAAGAVLLWFRAEAWRPWECVWMARAIAESCAPIIAPQIQEAATASSLCEVA